MGRSVLLTSWSPWQGGQGWGGFSCSLLMGLGHASTYLASLVQDLENQMHIAEQRRRTLLKDFHDT